MKKKRTNELDPIMVQAAAQRDYINQALFSDIKEMVNEAIRTAVENCEENDTNTVSISFDIDRNMNIEGQIATKTGEVVKAFLPIEAKVSLVSKKKLINEKVKTDIFTAYNDQTFGELKIEKLQKSLFDPE